MLRNEYNIKDKGGLSWSSLGDKKGIARQDDRNERNAAKRQHSTLAVSPDHRVTVRMGNKQCVQ
jgi:hypothetical protein